MNLSTVSDTVSDFFSARRERDNVKQRCECLRIIGVQRDAVMEVFAKYGEAQAMATADRIAAQMRAIRTRYDTRPDSPDAA